MSMTLEQVRDWLRDVGDETLIGHRYALADAIDAALAQPAQSVDVWAIREVIGDMDASSINDHIIDVWTDKLTRAIGNAQAEVPNES